jgi:hypothetical protein
MTASTTWPFQDHRQLARPRHGRSDRLLGSQPGLGGARALGAARTLTTAAASGDRTNLCTVLVTLRSLTVALPERHAAQPCGVGAHDSHGRAIMDVGSRRSSDH